MARAQRQSGGGRRTPYPVGTLYVGGTNDLQRRMYEYKHGLVPGFTKEYGARILVCCEETRDLNAVIAKEKEIKKWNQAWKLELIKSINPNWNDLSAQRFSDQPTDETSSEETGFPIKPGMRRAQETVLSCGNHAVPNLIWHSPAEVDLETSPG